jgi:TolA-binding protein
MPRAKTVFGFPPETVLYWASEVRVWAMFLAAIAAIVSLAASFAQIGLQEEVSAAKDEEFRRLQVESQQRIATAQAEAASAQERAAELSREAERTRLEHEQLRTRLAWRRIDPEQRRQIADALRAANLKPAIFVTTSDPEAAQFRADLVETLREAGDPNPNWRMPAGGSTFAGLSVQGPKEEERLVVASVFEQTGFSIQNAGQADRLTIVIGTKPPPN